MGILIHDPMIRNLEIDFRGNYYVAPSAEGNLIPNFGIYVDGSDVNIIFEKRCPQELLVEVSHLDMFVGQQMTSKIVDTVRAVIMQKLYDLATTGRLYKSPISKEWVLAECV